ncbi:MAG: FlgD immunoglobulin-like domain containing protein [candidate division WOR-3 bacterium]
MVARFLLLVSLASLVLWLSTANAEGGLPGAMLNYAPAPRALALGKAFTGVSDDAQAVYFNPGGLFQLNSHEVMLAHSQLYGARLEYIAYALPTKEWGTFGLNLLNYGAEGLESRTPDNQHWDNYVFFENAYMMSYCYSPVRFLGFGATLKVVTKNIAQYSDIGIGADLGVLVTRPEPLSFGLFAQNLIAPTLQLRNMTEKFPRSLRAGAAVRLLDGRATVTADVSTPLLLGRDSIGNPTTRFTLGLIPRGGAEFALVPGIFYQRVGMDPNEISLGLGVHKAWGKMAIGIDYAFLLHYQSNYRLAPTHKAGVFLDFSGFRVWIDATPPVFTPTLEQEQNVLWMDVRLMSRAPIKRWQVLIKNAFGEIVRTFSGWEKPPLRMSWDGLDDAGRLVADGRYQYEIVVVDIHDSPLEFSGFLTEIKTKGPRGKVEIRPGE